MAMERFSGLARQVLYFKFQLIIVCKPVLQSILLLLFQLFHMFSIYIHCSQTCFCSFRQRITVCMRMHRLHASCSLSMYLT